MKLQQLKENNSNKSLKDAQGGKIYDHVVDFKFTQGGITSLEGGPSIVDGEYNVSYNSLVYLDHSPEKVRKDFQCNRNMLLSLKNGPKAVGGDYVCGNNYLTSLEGIAEHVGGRVYASNNKITSLKGIHKYIKHVNEFLYLPDNPVESHILGVLLINGLKFVNIDNKDVELIINKHFGKGMAGVLAAQEELEDAGFGAFAQL